MEELPPFNILVKVFGTWYGGEWSAEAMRKQYKKPKNKGTRAGWRWVHEDGERLSDQHVHRWEPVTKGNLQ